jgi:hypothetical protein
MAGQGGASQMHAENIKLWLLGISLEEDPKKGPNNVGEGDVYPRMGGQPKIS